MFRKRKIVFDQRDTVFSIVSAEGSIDKAAILEDHSAALAKNYIRPDELDLILEALVRDTKIKKDEDERYSLASGSVGFSGYYFETEKVRKEKARDLVFRIIPIGLTLLSISITINQCVQNKEKQKTIEALNAQNTKNLKTIDSLVRHSKDPESIHQLVKPEIEPGL